MKIKNSVSLIVLTTTVLLQAFAPREWLQQNATHEDKKLIASLLINNADANIKTATYVFVIENPMNLPC